VPTGGFSEDPPDRHDGKAERTRGSRDHPGDWMPELTGEHREVKLLTKTVVPESAEADQFYVSTFPTLSYRINPRWTDKLQLIFFST
jgi:hypothetical protein